MESYTMCSIRCGFFRWPFCLQSVYVTWGYRMICCLHWEVSTTRICYNFPSRAPWGTWRFCVGSRSPASSWGQGLCYEAAPHAASSSATAGSKKPDQGLLCSHRPFCHLCPFPRAQPKDPHPLGPTMSTASSSPLTLTPRESLPFRSWGVVLSL